MATPRDADVASSPKATKRCARCGETKLVSEFHKHAKRADGLQVYCKSRRAVIDHERYRRQHGGPRRSRVFDANRANWMRELKSGRPCADCGRTFPPAVMQMGSPTRNSQARQPEHAFQGSVPCCDFGGARQV